MQIQIRNNVETYMKELAEWLQSIQDTPTEEMEEFFAKRIGSYEEHMSLWKGAYAFLAGQVPENTEKLLDLGCGTGLELGEKYKLLPRVRVTGIDLCPAMLEMLLKKFESREPKLICGDYFEEELGEAVYDTAVSFQTCTISGRKKSSRFLTRYSQQSNRAAFIWRQIILPAAKKKNACFGPPVGKKEGTGAYRKRSLFILIFPSPWNTKWSCSTGQALTG